MYISIDNILVLFIISNIYNRRVYNDYDIPVKFVILNIILIIISLLHKIIYCLQRLLYF